MIAEDVTDASRTLSCQCAGAAILEQTSGAAAVTCHQIAVVAGFVGIKRTIAADVAWLATVTANEIADGSSTLSCHSARAATFEKARNVAIVSGRQIAIVAGFASIERTIAADVSRLAAVTAEEIADATSALICHSAGAAILEETVGAAAVPCS